MKIRPANPDDVPAILTLERESAAAAHWTDQHYRAAFRKGGPMRTVLVAEDGPLIGFLVARGGQPEWEIENIAVAQHAQRHGAGTRLVGELLRLARNAAASAVFLEVRRSNLAARRLYEKTGFVEDGVREGYYREPDEDAVLYALRFE